MLRRPTLSGAFLVWMFVGSLAVYSWASERMPWLVLHSLLPLVLLAGIGGQTLWNARARLSSRLAMAVVAVAAVGALSSSIAALLLPLRGRERAARAGADVRRPPRDS